MTPEKRTRLRKACEAAPDPSMAGASVATVLALLDALDAAEARIKAVLDEHVDDGYGKCIGCYGTWPCYVEDLPDHPCAIRRALDGEGV